MKAPEEIGCGSVAGHSLVEQAGRASTVREVVQASFILGLLLNVVFFPALWGGRTLMTSAWDAPSVTQSGAYNGGTLPRRIRRTPDPGPPAWQTEPWFKIISNQYWNEHPLPPFNPYNLPHH